ncbi:hypothetical protein F8M41_005844 [Gigaspora margarita]|uniref:Uncharacterized protein n=1 Tax=Gigaspora margarita TaxID=4874 RepID=A0A8H3X846_GIGMA|nr:hypothetical protein F8M41_005844 [Gigaspora margarita]
MCLRCPGGVFECDCGNGFKNQYGYCDCRARGADYSSLSTFPGRVCPISKLPPAPMGIWVGHTCNCS